MSRVWIAQCLCPQRHCILASAGEADDATAAEKTVVAELRKQMDALLLAGVLNPWCGLCKAAAADWHYEVGRTRFASMDEAQESLKTIEREMAMTAILYGDHGKR